MFPRMLRLNKWLKKTTDPKRLREKAAFKFLLPRHIYIQSTLTEQTLFMKNNSYFHILTYAFMSSHPHKYIHVFSHMHIESFAQCLFCLYWEEHSLHCFEDTFLVIFLRVKDVHYALTDSSGRDVVPQMWGWWSDLCRCSPLVKVSLGKKLVPL